MDAVTDRDDVLTNCDDVFTDRDELTTRDDAFTDRDELTTRDDAFTTCDASSLIAAATTRIASTVASTSLAALLSVWTNSTRATGSACSVPLTAEEGERRKRSASGNAEEYSRNPTVAARGCERSRDLRERRMRKGAAAWSDRKLRCDLSRRERA